MKLSPILLHTVACGWYVFFWYQHLSISIEHAESNPEYRDLVELRWRYFTNWNLVMQTLYFIGCLLYDLMKFLIGPNCLRLGPKLQSLVLSNYSKLLSGSFSSIILPYGMYIPVLFWAIYGIDRELVYPKALDDVVPFWHNHGMHTVILPLAFAELMTTKHRVLPVKVLATVLFIYGSIYLILLFETYVETGRWLYPLLGMFSLPVAIAIGIFVQSLSSGFLFFGIFIQNIIWGEEENNGYGETVKKSG